MKSKKAFLLGAYTLKIIIAVLCILLLVYVLFTLYSDSRNTKDLRMAKAVLEDLSEKMMMAKQNSPQDFVVLGFRGWGLLSYSEEENMPLSCEESCICLCDKVEHSDKKQVEACNEKGVCKNFDEKIKKFRLGYYWKENTGWGAEEIGDFKIEYKNNEFTMTRK